MAADGRLLPRSPAPAKPLTARPPTARQQPTARQWERPTARQQQQRPAVRPERWPFGPAAQSADDRAGSAARTPLRLTRRGRIVVTAAAVLAIGAASIAVSGAAQATGHSGAPAAPAGPGGAVTRVEIRSGESLWSVAEAYDPDADTRAVIREIQQMNSLTSDQVQPGQTLWVPRG